MRAAEKHDVTTPEEQLSSFSKAYRAAAPWLNASAKLTTGPMVGVLGGWLFDNWKGSAPWGLLVGSMVGLAAGFIGFITDVLKMSKKKETK